MGKKITRWQRQRMLALIEEGTPKSEVKRKFGIKDNRTLEKHLRQAHVEQRIEVARSAILKESLTAHVGEIRTLIERWRSLIVAPNIEDLYHGSMEWIQACENERLFPCIKEHLPFPKLWMDYANWKAKRGQYVMGGERLHNDIREEAASVLGLEFNQEDFQPGLTSSFDRPMFTAFSQRALGKGVSLKYTAGSLARPGKGTVEYLDVQGTVVLYAAKDAANYEEKYQNMLDEYLVSEQLASLIATLEDLRKLEMGIHDLLEEALLRRDYILYSCRLCPGQGKP